MTSPVLTVACLCAAWCGTCGEYRPIFDQLQAARPADRFRWIDIEDEADLVGEVDVETFPTLLVTREDGQVLFAGPVLPRLNDALRLLEAQAESMEDGCAPSGAAGMPVDQVLAFEALAQALRGQSPG